MSDAAGGIAVIDTGVILGLSRAGLAELPLKLFDRVILTYAVVTELLAKSFQECNDVINLLAGAEQQSPVEFQNEPLLSGIDKGEAAVIATAKDLPNPSVLMDERRGRKIAETVFGLRVKGTMWLLLEAKRRGIISAVRPAIHDMLNAGYFLSDSLVRQCLEKAGEAPAATVK